MDFARKLAAALVLALAIAPAAALTDKDKSDCEQMVNPALKVAACTRVLESQNPAKDLLAFGHHHRGVGLLLQSKLDGAIAEFNEADPPRPEFCLCL
jgi:hypothetical protein